MTKKQDSLLIDDINRLKYRRHVELMAFCNDCGLCESRWEFRKHFKQRHKEHNVNIPRTKQEVPVEEVDDNVIKIIKLYHNDISVGELYLDEEQYNMLSIVLQKAMDVINDFSLDKWETVKEAK